MHKVALTYKVGRAAQEHLRMEKGNSSPLEARDEYLFRVG